MFFAALGTAVVALALAVYKCGSSHDVALCTVALAGLSLVAVFGVGMDVVHGLARGSSLQAMTAVVEDGGELLATSLLAAAIVAVLMYPRPSG